MTSDGGPGEESALPPEVAAGLRGTGGREGLLAKMPSGRSLQASAERYQALSDPTRLLIMHLLGESVLCPCVLKDLTGLTDSKLSYHLSILERAGLVAWRQNKNWRVYGLTALGRDCLKDRLP